MDNDQVEEQDALDTAKDFIFEWGNSGTSPEIGGTDFAIGALAYALIALVERIERANDFLDDISVALAKSTD